MSCDAKDKAEMEVQTSTNTEICESETQLIDGLPKASESSLKSDGSDVIINSDNGSLPNHSDDVFTETEPIELPVCQKECDVVKEVAVSDDIEETISNIIDKLDKIEETTLVENSEDLTIDNTEDLVIDNSEDLGIDTQSSSNIENHSTENLKMQLLSMYFSSYQFF